MKRGGKHKRRAQKRKSLKNADFYLLKDKQILRDRNQWRDRDFVLFTFFFLENPEKITREYTKNQEEIVKEGKGGNEGWWALLFIHSLSLVKKKKKKNRSVSQTDSEREKETWLTRLLSCCSMSNTPHMFDLYTTLPSHPPALNYYYSTLLASLNKINTLLYD